MPTVLLSSKVTTVGIADDTITNVMVNSAAAIAYSKLSLTGSIVGGDLASNIAISTTGNITTEGTLSAQHGTNVHKFGANNTALEHLRKCMFPDSVSTSEIDGNEGMLGIAGWDKTSARLVKAIQELASENEVLRDRVSALEAQV